LGDVRGKSVLDLCAAPGGKTLQLAARGGRVTAVEKSEERIKRIQSNLNRVGLAANIVCDDVRDFTPDKLAPCVLLDAPCTATGTIRRHPELPWIKSATDINHCASAAGELLESAAAMTAPDGLLVFAVCSLEPEEGIEQVEAFLSSNAGFERSPVSANELFGHHQWISPEGDLRTLPCHLAEQGGMDGFYASRLRRKK
jgi:16S rRNA (cytosine967-C5)-methyltransferase